MIYGLVSEIGSLLSEFKKQYLHQNNYNTENIKEELGDIVWYAVSLANLEELNFERDILLSNLKTIKKDYHTQTDNKVPSFHSVWKDSLPSDLKKTIEIQDSFDEFQKRVKSISIEESLRERCQPWLAYHTAQLLDNNQRAKENLKKTLGHIMWHVAAIAEACEVKLSDIAQNNVKKIKDLYKKDDDNHTPLHDEEVPPEEQFPRQFKITFVTTKNQKARMYFENKTLGNDLDDNISEEGEDFYRFHDALHLGHVAVLGWSPVIRGLMKRKRKSDKKADRIQDGARARIVEEAVVKLIHTEGGKIAKERGGRSQELFLSNALILPRLLKQIKDLTQKLEVEQNKKWEWKKAIREGYKIFNDLVKHKEGTVCIDLENRCLKFDPKIELDFPGLVSGAGTSYLKKSEIPEPQTNEWENFIEQHFTENEYCEINNSRELAALSKAGKEAVWRAIGAGPNVIYKEIEILNNDEGKFLVQLRDNTREKAREKGMLIFKLQLDFFNGFALAHALALSDPAGFFPDPD